MKPQNLACWSPWYFGGWLLSELQQGQALGLRLGWCIRKIPPSQEDVNDPKSTHNCKHLAFYQTWEGNMTSTRVLQLLPSCSYACNTKQNAPFPSSTFKRVVPWSFSNTPLKNLYTRTMLKSVCSSIHEPVASPSVSELSSQDQWATFESSVTGEWEGSTATFDSAGVPQELDQYYVPQDYR